MQWMCLVRDFVFFVLNKLFVLLLLFSLVKIHILSLTRCWYSILWFKCDQLRLWFWSYKPWAAFVLFRFRFTFLRLSMPFFRILLYSSITFGTSSCDTTVDSFFDDAFARIKHLYSSGSGSGGRPSRGFGRSCPSSETYWILINQHTQSEGKRLKKKRCIGFNCKPQFISHHIFCSSISTEMHTVLFFCLYLHRFKVNENGIDLLFALWINRTNWARNCN